jgi:hypothetical protein
MPRHDGPWPEGAPTRRRKSRNHGKAKVKARNNPMRTQKFWWTRPRKRKSNIGGTFCGKRYAWLLYKCMRGGIRSNRVTCAVVVGYARKAVKKKAEEAGEVYRKFHLGNVV